MGERLCRHFPIQPSWGNINRDKKDVKDNRKSLMVGQNASKGVETIQNAGNQPDFCLVKEKIMKNAIKTHSRNLCIESAQSHTSDCHSRGISQQLLE